MSESTEITIFRHLPPMLYRAEIGIVRDTDFLDDPEVESWARAMQIAVDRDFAPIWNAGARITVHRNRDDVPPTSWLCALLDRSGEADALGYHEKTDAGLPILKVGVGDDLDSGDLWTTTAAHEIFETLADPNLDRVVRIIGPDRATWEYAVEVCDTCEDDRFAYYVADPGTGQQHRISDFAYPDWWNPAASAGAIMTHRRTVTRPLELAEGGYIGCRQVAPVLGEWTQRFAAGGDLTPRMVKKPTSRTIRRFRAAV